MPEYVVLALSFIPSFTALFILTIHIREIRTIEVKLDKFEDKLDELKRRVKYAELDAAKGLRICSRLEEHLGIQWLKPFPHYVDTIKESE